VQDDSEEGAVDVDIAVVLQKAQIMELKVAPRSKLRGITSCNCLLDWLPHLSRVESVHRQQRHRGRGLFKPFHGERLLFHLLH
jgi:hypothetical protein